MLHQLLFDANCFQNNLFKLRIMCGYFRTIILFFVLQVRDVRLILDNKSHRSKGIAYIEFKDIESVPLAIGLSGQRLLGVPIIVQNAHAERNRQASTNQPASLMLSGVMKSAAAEGPGRLYVGSLHPNITDDMLKGIFEPFGKVSARILCSIIV